MINTIKGKCLEKLSILFKVKYVTAEVGIKLNLSNYKSLILNILYNPLQHSLIQRIENTQKLLFLICDLFYLVLVTSK